MDYGEGEVEGGWVEMTTDTLFSTALRTLHVAKCILTGAAHTLERQVRFKSRGNVGARSPPERARDVSAHPRPRSQNLAP